MTWMNGAQAVIKVLENHGIHHVFGLPGGAVLSLYDALRESSITHTLVRHEAAAAHAASGYARATGSVGVCIATSGPGATNLLTGIAVSLAAQGNSPLQALKSAVYLHGLAGDIAAEKYTQYCATIERITDCIPEALSLICEKGL